MEKIYITRKSIEEEILQDTAYTIKRIVDNSDDNLYISFEKDDYTFYPSYTNEEYHFVTNNDYGLQKIAFLLKNKHHITIDGNGSSFLFIGRIAPFFIQQSSNITLKNFSIDYKRAMYTQGKIIEATEKYVTLDIDKKEYPYHVAEDGHIVFTGENYESDWSWGMMEFDSFKNIPKDDVVDYIIKDRMYGEECENGLLKVIYPFDNMVKEGNILVIKHEMRLIQAITLDRSSEIKLENITINHCGSMAVTAQFCSNLSINNIKVSPSKDRCVSANADAVHCVGCRGLIKIENSLFENQMDDALNVHGNYLLIEKIIDKNKILAKIGHFQHFGIFDFDKGSTIQISNCSTFEDVERVSVKDTQIINNQYIIISFNEDLKLENGIQYCIDNIDSYPQLIFRNNVCRNNRARGILLKTRFKTLIENNIIHSTGTAIKICADMNFWFESGKSTQIIIRENDISAKRTKIWGKAIIDIDPEMLEIKDSEYFMGSIEILNNTINLNNTPLIYGISIEKLTIKDNLINVLDDRNISDNNIPLDLNHVLNIDVDHNQYKYGK